METGGMTERFNGPCRVQYLKQDECLKRFLSDDDTWPGIVLPELGIIYVEPDQKSISYICPCNGTHPDGDCKQFVQTIPIDGSRGWGFRDESGVPTITPSVFRRPPNGCHYFIRNGMVEWC
jgi:hypothetical protein